ncbi:MAG: outer membrane lipoprotein carrier protein LolA [Candidatus Heimdallarchaeota archaeon]|nr:outer membrane lipoprotein carrier protein LolA [Candidatus Heimdallarchaeota archaeon]
MAQSSDLIEIAQKLQYTYEKASNLVADFNQTTSIKSSQRVRKGSGSMVFLKPGRMRWDYITPDHQVLASDGESISMYFEKSNQMIISDARDYLQSDVTYSFFAGTGDILKDFDITEPDFENMTDNSHLLKMIPKSMHPQVSFIHAWIDDETFLLEHLRIVDHFDTVTDLFFKDIQIDSNSYGGREITKNLFSFTPPANTEIIKQY